MKKNGKLILAAITGVAMLTGCATTKVALNPEELSPVAVVTVRANEEISWYGEEESSGAGKGLLDKFITKNTNEDTQVLLSRTTPLLDDALDAVYEVLSSVNIKLVEKENVINSSCYLSAEENKMLKAAAFVCPEGYRILSSNDSAFSKSLMAETGASSCIYISFDINKIIRTGVGKNGKMTACVTTNLEIVNSEGKTVARLNGYATCEDSIAIVGGIYDPKKLNAMFPSTIRASLENAVEKL